MVYRDFLFELNLKVNHVTPIVNCFASKQFHSLLLVIYIPLKTINIIINIIK